MIGYTDDHEHYDYAEKRDLNDLDSKVRQLEREVEGLRVTVRGLLDRERPAE